ncbi:MAG TPA: anaerobic ribonucleoside-triphosphate reductase activating protein [Candidatus Hydrogenedentes bacterium]|nr:anaerobic ribonucleoside-triphosphate reductase activating protein [Candidatus Hydrogenedentota bacterium]HOL78052.1 anaerobic ribonucleoside-triphosphate reductase activating protein [Candidatus Hydrogenedentota bacterium]HPO84588.1 anaerobic ribonucleoside-triphosphate reductase activating protein [Candidatus Hydrogenedentota bacterium]
MRIAGIEPCSFVDWPGHVVAVLFTPGCNLDCYYCHNRHLVSLGNGEQTRAELTKILRWLEMRRGFLEGVVFSGGEATLQTGLEEFVRQVRNLGFKTKLDTNGTQPRRLEKLLTDSLFDYVAMDVKASGTKYDSICRAKVSQEDIDASIHAIITLAPDYEFRTTVVPQLSELDILEIAARIHGAKRYVLQQYRKPPVYGATADLRTLHTPLPMEIVREMAKKASIYVAECTLRGFASVKNSTLAISG